MTDEELVDLARRGDPDAFGELVDRHQAAVYRTACAAVRVASDAEDVAQEALVRAWRHLDQFRGAASFRTWLLTITWNQAMSYRRSPWRWLRRAVPVGDDMQIAPPRGESEAHGRELKAEVARAIEALTPKLRDALLLAQSGEYRYDEIGDVLKIPVGTVKWRVSEARRLVRAHLAAKGFVDAR